MNPLFDRRWFRALVRLLGGHVEWEVQKQDHQKCFRTWSNGFVTYHQAADYIHVERHKYRIEGRVVFSRYFANTQPKETQ